MLSAVFSAVFFNFFVDLSFDKTMVASAPMVNPIAIPFIVDPMLFILILLFLNIICYDRAKNTNLAKNLYYLVSKNANNIVAKVR